MMRACQRGRSWRDLTDPGVWVGLLTLVALEIVLSWHGVEQGGELRAV
jgi:hypothetical protein